MTRVEVKEAQLFHVIPKRVEKMKLKQIIYVYPHASTFILRDVELLSEEYDVVPYEFSVKSKLKVPFEFIRQFFFLMMNTRRSSVIICHFAGYSSFLPALFGKVFRRPCFIIVAGNDGSRFMDFKYGNFTKKLLGFFTGISLKWATHVLPVHESLYFQEYSYYEGGMPSQGYSVFSPKSAKTPYTPVYYGYDTTFFKNSELTTRRKDSFISIGNFNNRYCFFRKGFDLIIELARMRPDLHFTLVGWDGKKEIDAPANVKLVPFLPIDQIVEILNEHEYYFQLSIMEGFPNALAEAMLCGCIPIGSNVSGIPLIIGDTGYLLYKKDINELNKLIDLVLEDSRRKSLPTEARNRICENFTYDIRRKKISALIEQYT